MKTKKAFTQFIAVIISVLCMICNCNIGFALSVAAEESNGFESTDSSSAPDDYIPIESTEKMASFSMRKSAVDTSLKRVLLVEDTLPWSSNANNTILSSLGVTYDKVKASEFLSQDLGNYSVLIFANDQQFSTYANYSNFMTQVENFASLGGVVVFGACDGGWAKGTLSTALPCGVTKIHQYANYNYIVDSTHPIVTGELIDNIAITDSDLYSNYCSHTSFDESTFPTGSTVILRDKILNAPTLIEYPVGDGKVIASGLTWEHNYAYSNAFGKKAMSDLFMYAVSISNADVNMRPPVALSVTGDDYISTTSINYITASIKNIGNDRASNVKLTVTVPDGVEITNESNSNSEFWPVLKVGETENCKWGLKIKKGFVVPGADQVAEIKIRLEYLIPDTLEIESKEIIKKLYVDEDKNAIIVIPGIAGTRLFANSDMDAKDYLLPEFNESKHNKYSYNAGHQFWEPETSKGTQKLAAATYYQNEIQSEVMMLICDAMGNSLADIRPETSYENAQYGAQNTYTKLVNDLEYEFGDEYCVDFFSYDWRKDVSEAAKSLETYIEKHEYDSVILVCHSMGGLVASKYLANSEQNQDKVDKLITIGTPYLGAPKALYVFETGALLDNLRTTFCMGTPIKAIANNLTAVYELLPTKNYFDLNDTTYVQYQNNNGFWNKKSTSKQSYSETQNLIKSREWYLDNGTPKNFIDVSENFAESVFVNGEHITSKVESYYIIGYNKDTILEVEEEYNKDGSFDKCSDLTIANGGDGTVPVISANIGGLADSEKTYYIEESHTGLVSNGYVLDLVGNIINGDSNKYDNKISKSLPEKVNEEHWYGDKSIRIKLKVECPVDLAMIDDNGEEWAYVNPAYIYNNNPYDGTFYHLGKNNDAKMAFLQDKNFNVKLIGADKGVMKYTMSVLDSGNEIQRIVFEKIDITDTTVIYTNTDRFNSITLSVDTDNNGIIDYHVNPSYILTEDEIDDLENIDTGESILIFEKSSIITSSVETGLQIYAGSVNINKSISTDGLCEIYANEVNTINCNTKSFSVNGQLAESHKELYYLEATEGIDEFLHNVQDILPEDAVSLVDTDMIYYTTQKISDFVTANSIAIYLDKINSDENCVLYSRNGNINISGSEVNYNGIIYAPNGTVTISANDVRISGTIIAKKVIVYGTNVTFE